MCYSFQWLPFDHRALVQIKNIYSPTSRLFSWLKSSTLHCVCVHMQTGAWVYASDNYCHCHACLMAPWDTNELSPLLPTQHSLEHMGRLEVERGGMAEVEVAPWSQDSEFVLRPGITERQDKVNIILLVKGQPQPGMGVRVCTLSTWWERQEDQEVKSGNSGL